MMAAIASTSLEVSGFGTVDVLKNGVPIDWRVLRQAPPERAFGITFNVTKAWLLDVGGWGDTDIRPDVAAQFYHDRLQEGYEMHQFKLWWHRHPLFSGWSGTDENCIQNTPMGNSVEPALTEWLVALVWCTGTGWNGRFDQVTNPRFTLHVPVTIDDVLDCGPTIQQTVRSLAPRSNTSTSIVINTPRTWTHAWTPGDTTPIFADDELDLIEQQQLFNTWDEDLADEELADLYGVNQEFLDTLEEELYNVDWGTQGQIGEMFIADALLRLEGEILHQGQDQQLIERILLEELEAYGLDLWRQDVLNVSRNLTC